MSNRLFCKDFNIMVAGQIISLFGNAILRFALSLYVLDQTGSAAVFGGIVALSMIPTIVLSPVGGVLADRLPRQRIMVALDFFTAALIFFCYFLFANTVSLPAITVFMVLLALIQAIYQPSVQASIPSLVENTYLMSANGIVLQVQALAALLGPVIGGFLYSYLGIYRIFIISGICFAFSAVMELFLRIPYIQQARTAPLAAIKKDLSEALRYLIHENPRLMQLLIIVAGINLFLSALFIIGLPFLVKIHLGLSAQLYGFAEAALGFGSILGGLMSGMVSHRVPFRKVYVFLLGTTVLLLPTIFVLLWNAPHLVTYAVLLFSVVFGMGCAALFNIAAQTFIQQQTPHQLLGKVGAFITTVCTCALPIGQAMYGGLFDLFQSVPWVVMLFGCAVSFLLVLAVRRALHGVTES